MSSGSRGRTDLAWGHCREAPELSVGCKKTKLGPVCLLENSFLLKSEFWDSEFQESELFSDVWYCNEK
jgi:hypothetical protein